MVATKTIALPVGPVRGSETGRPIMAALEPMLDWSEDWAKALAAKG